MHSHHCVRSIFAHFDYGATDVLGKSKAVEKDRTEGNAKAAKGSLKEAIGKIVGSETIQGQGAAEKASGEAQEAAGKGKDARRDTGKT